MSNLVGEPFDDYITKQVLDRQKIHGSQTRDNSTLSYLNSNTSWIRVVSGVKIAYSTEGTERLNAIGLKGHPSFGGSGLAKAFVLFNGTSDASGTQFHGIDRQQQDIGQTILNKAAYGLGGTEFGIRPMPGVSSCETKFRNRGSIREGTIQIKAFSRTQLEIISLLYLRLGYPVLLEWGHSIYINTDGKVNTNPNFTVSQNFLNETFKNDNELLKALEDKRAESCGNYDAMYGKVVNFDWTFNKDGTYDITLKLISIGAVVESLKTNVYTSDPTSQSAEKKADDEQPENDQGWIIKYKNSHDIGKKLFMFWRQIATNGVDINGISSIEFAGSKLFIHSTELDTYYINFLFFLNMIKDLTPINVSDKKNPTSILNIELNNNYIYTENLQLSSDPRICLVGGFELNEFENRKIIPQLDSNPFKKNINGVQVGLLNNIYLNTTLIIQKLNDLKDENGKVSYFDFIQNILDSVTKALGNLNKLSLVVDENTNTAKIIDDTPIPGIEKAFPEVFSKQKESPSFNIYGYYQNGNSAGFIRDFSLKTEISSNLMSALTIGATANGSVVGEDATAFSKWNKGLEPILNKKIDYPNNKSSEEENIPNKLNQLNKENSQLRVAFYKYINDSSLENGNIFGELDTDNLDGNVDVVSNYISFVKNYNALAQQNKAPSSPKIASATSSRGFLPINLSLTMDGLSGIKIYQQIKIDTAFLPSDYPTSLKFIIKGVTHKIDKSGWLTSIETVSVPVIDALEENSPVSTNKNQTQMIPPTTEPRGESRNNIPRPYKISDNGIQQLIRFEGKRNVVYDDATGKPIANYTELKGYPTIGVGHLIKPTEKDKYAKYLKGVGVMPDSEIQSLLKTDLTGRETQLNNLIKADITQGQFDALMGMGYNTGFGNISFQKAVKLTNEGNKQAASDAIKNGPTTSKGVVLQGLVTRRNAEATEYLT